MNSILLSSVSNEWYTPLTYVEAARSVMGSIDLDPASCEHANVVIKAPEYYTLETDGLTKNWYGNIWLNPPYGATKGKSNQGVWARKLIAEYDKGNVSQAILLVNAKTDTRWFGPLWRFPICFTSGRVNFYTSKQSTTVGNTNGSAFVYLGAHMQKFAEIFQQFGHIVYPDWAVKLHG